jgi:hypothetical protein
MDTQPKWRLLKKGASFVFALVIGVATFASLEILFVTSLTIRGLGGDDAAFVEALILSMGLLPVFLGVSVVAGFFATRWITLLLAATGLVAGFWMISIIVTTCSRIICLFQDGLNTISRLA